METTFSTVETVLVTLYPSYVMDIPTVEMDQMRTTVTYVRSWKVTVNFVK